MKDNVSIACSLMTRAALLKIAPSPFHIPDGKDWPD